jgi:hypothetical protein
MQEENAADNIETGSDDSNYIAIITGKPVEILTPIV